MPELILYSTLGCHLCEQAKLVIEPVMNQYQLHYEEVDIADSEQLLDAYGVLIPVFKYANSEQYLNWPFSATEVREYMTKLAD